MCDNLSGENPTVGLHVYDVETNDERDVVLCPTNCANTTADLPRRRATSVVLQGNALRFSSPSASPVAGV